MLDTWTRMMGRRDVFKVLLAGAGVAASPLVAAAVEVGEKAPDFTLPSTTGEKISLSQFRGKNLVLLEFYVHDFGPT
jgi:peroxiredoxin